MKWIKYIAIIQCTIAKKEKREYKKILKEVAVVI